MEERKELIIIQAKYPAKKEEAVTKIREIDNLIRLYLTPAEESARHPEIKTEYNSDCESEVPSEDSDYSKSTVNWSEFVEKRRAEQEWVKQQAFNRIFRKSDLYVTYMKTRKRQYYRKINK